MSSRSDVAIRRYRLNDVDALFEAAMESRDELAPWLPWCHPGYSIDDSRLWVELQVVSFDEGTEYSFVIESAEGQFLGGCGLNMLDVSNRRANLGYWVRSSATGGGVASAAVRQLVDWAWKNTYFNRLEVLASVKNVRSQRVAEKAGAVREGILRARLMLQDEAHDAVVYSFVRR